MSWLSNVVKTVTKAAGDTVNAVKKAASDVQPVLRAINPAQSLVGAVAKGVQTGSVSTAFDQFAQDRVRGAAIGAAGLAVTVGAPAVAGAIGSAGTAVLSAGGSVSLLDRLKGAASGLLGTVVDVAKEQGQSIIRNAVNDVTARVEGAQSVFQAAGTAATAQTAAQSAANNPLFWALGAVLLVLIATRK